MKTVEEWEEEIEMTIQYLAYLHMRLDMAKTIRKGHEASAAILTKKLMERVKND